jgi:endonuclease/exonuclease/phosphatase family metal-dependent hydrolase
MGHGRSSALLFVVLTAALGCVGRHRVDEERPPELPPSTDDSLRLVTFNAWGVPFRDRHDDLLDRVAPVLERYAPDVVVLQEIWFEEDAERVAESLRSIGLTHEVHHASDAVLAQGSAGLMIASRWPIVHHDFHPFRAGRLPIRPWHVDWFSGKGVATATIDHPSGRYRIGTAHLQADYDGVVYTDVRLAQGAELVAAMGWRPVHAVAGDFNSRPDELEHRMLVEALGVRSIDSGEGVDDILVREGVGIRGQWKSPAPSTELDGETIAVSDHPILIADLAIEGEPSEPTLGPDLRGELEAFFDERAHYRAYKRTGGWFLVLLAFFLVGASARNRKRGGRRMARTALLALALASTLGAYLGVGVGTARDVWRDQARAILLAEP